MSIDATVRDSLNTAQSPAKEQKNKKIKRGVGTMSIRSGHPPGPEEDRRWAARPLQDLEQSCTFAKPPVFQRLWA